MLRTRVNGEVVQEDISANLLFPFGLLIADLRASSPSSPATSS